MIHPDESMEQLGWEIAIGECDTELELARLGQSIKDDSGELTEYSLERLRERWRERLEWIQRGRK